MTVTPRDAQTLALLSPEELALCYILVKLAFPATWQHDNDGGLIEYVARRYFSDGYMQ